LNTADHHRPNVSGLKNSLVVEPDLP